jgi:hypothetical protein
MAGAIVLDQIPFEIDEAALFQQLRVRPDRGEPVEVRRLMAEATALARPKALYKIAFVDVLGEDCVVIDGETLTSRVLAVNLNGAHRVFVFAATGGRELEAWQSGQTDMLEAYWADQIAELGVRAAMDALRRHLESVYDLAQVSMMNPGSLADWPIQQQRPLFGILGDTESTIGLALTPSMLMMPRKSVSGILFPGGESFASCQLCPREACPNRRAPYDSELYERKYRATL